jgi:hypothetical protein
VFWQLIYSSNKRQHILLIHFSLFFRENSGDIYDSWEKRERNFSNEAEGKCYPYNDDSRKKLNKKKTRKGGRGIIRAEEKKVCSVSSFGRIGW